jgi:peptidoglycan hydrolase-like protein with peptidoglycan-binding domain
MTLFEGFPTYDRFRTLHLTGPATRGEDVYALQTALDATGFDTGGADGILGTRTAQAIVEAQKKLGLAVDGLAGGGTQKALALRIATGVRTRHGLPSGALHGQLEHESGFRLGNYSPLMGRLTLGSLSGTRRTPPPARGSMCPTASRRWVR